MVRNSLTIPVIRVSATTLTIILFLVVPPLIALALRLVRGSRKPSAEQEDDEGGVRSGVLHWLLERALTLIGRGFGS